MEVVSGKSSTHVNDGSVRASTLESVEGRVSFEYLSQIYFPVCLSVGTTI